MFIESAYCSCLLNYISKLFCAIFLKTGSIRGKLLTTCTFIEKLLLRERERDWTQIILSRAHSMVPQL